MAPLKPADRLSPKSTRSAYAQQRTFLVTDTIACMADYDPDDKWQDEWKETIRSDGVALREKHLSNPWPHIPALPVAMRYFATELWDRGFS